MALELIVNAMLIIAVIFTFWYVRATMPESPADELGAEQWPQLLLVLMIIAIVFNLYNYFRKHKLEEIKAALVDFFPSVGRLIKSKLFRGMILLVLLAILYEPLGFFTTSLTFMIAYGVLLGARKPVLLIVSAMVITIVLYISFSVFLGVMLPRSYVPFLRNFALLLERLVGR
jgi:hypothetical protein